MMSAFCETYGNTLRNKALEFWLENHPLDFGIGDMAEEIGISRPKAYELAYQFEKESIIRKTRKVGRTQLYTLNDKNPKVKLHIRNFMECIRLVALEYQEGPVEIKDQPKSSKTKLTSSQV